MTDAHPIRPATPIPATAATRTAAPIPGVPRPLTGSRSGPGRHRARGATAAARRPPTATGRLTATVVAATAALIALSLALTPDAGAQTTSSTVATAARTTTVEPEGSYAGALVFFGMSLVIVGGAVILYLRHRPSRRLDRSAS